jgi:hypothetical protein
LIEMGSCKLFAWAGLKPPSCAFQVARSTGMNQHPQLSFCSLIYFSNIFSCFV